MTKRKIILCIMDGYGKGEDYPFNAVIKAKKPNLDMLFGKYPNSELACSGLDVGLPDGIMGNSEVGHLNIGAGRIVYQDITRINRSIEEGSFAKNPILLDIFDRTLSKNSKLHIMGLVSNGDVHSSLKHPAELVKAACGRGLKNIFVHAFTDGRDTPPESGASYVKELDDLIEPFGAKIASVSGRYYAMDRDKRWDRIHKAYKCLTEPQSIMGSAKNTAYEIITESYKNGITDEFIVPACVKENGVPVAPIEKGDSVIFFNFRADRAREITIALNRIEEVPFETKDLDLDFATMTEYREDFPFRTLYPKLYLNNILGEVVSSAGLKQLRIAETEKYAHVTFFFNGGDEKKFPGEERILIQSPKVATYDLLPEMSAYEVTDTLVKEIEKDIYDLIVLNFANCDMVGHTGIFEAARKAVETVDECVGMVYKAAMMKNYLMILTADHGNAEKMMDGDIPFTAHTTNRVPFLVTDEKLMISEGKLSDIAPTILSLMGVGIPSEMTGKILSGDKR
ncbi:MAG: 2,3-bisphosphoglycerate-independent phosphoglycerate mutase [Candidatus Delongbacteria bacterium]|nr:2,3-bisphosphoglycerate-independent phosphoglycerate mutase [Candidatus Delongbacteria bacterium]